MSISQRAKRICLVRGCGQPVKARGLCARHHQAHHVRGTPLEDLVPESKRTRALAVVDVHTRIPEGELAKLDTAIADGKAKGPRYAWLQRTILEAIEEL